MNPSSGGPGRASARAVGHGRRPQTGRPLTTSSSPSARPSPPASSATSAVPTSKQSERRAVEFQIPLTTLAQHPTVDVTVDGADEVAPGLDLIKGLGGASSARRSSPELQEAHHRRPGQGRPPPGHQEPLPVEVIQFASDAHEVFFRSLGCEPKLRMVAGGMAFVTDNNNFIYDCHFPAGIQDPAKIQSALKARAGIVETGLFLGLATVALIGTADGVTEMGRWPRRGAHPPMNRRATEEQGIGEDKPFGHR